MSLIHRVGVSVLAGALLSIACGATRDLQLQPDGGDSTPPPPPSFEPPPDGSVPVDVQEAGLLSYCPSSECPEGRTTCLISRFRCDVDLRTDRNNCGACGNACPAATSNEVYECVDGTCAMKCKAGALDCDGLVDNGCETRASNRNHCGACGNACPPGEPCMLQSTSLGDYGCGCKPGQLYCGSCINPKRDDENCGGCDIACDPSGDGGAAYPNMYNGCLDSKCDPQKCRPNWGNCDGKLENGCETDIRTSENCGGCGIQCAPGQECRLDVWGVPQCMCAAGQTFCSSGCTDGLCTGACFDLSSDRENCGACLNSCSAFDGARSLGVCTFGVCSRKCLAGWADCNGNEADDCEVNTDSDPLNCGGCGIVCDAVAGQACVRGRCVVKPCDVEEPDAGEVK